MKKKRGGPTESFLEEAGVTSRFSRRDVRTACLFACSIAVAGTLAMIWADVPLVRLAWLPPFLTSASIVIPLMVCLVLNCHGVALNERSILVLGSAFLLIATARTAASLFFSTPASVIAGGGLGELSPWICMAGQSGFAVLVAVYGRTVRPDTRRATDQAEPRTAVGISLLVLLAVTLACVALAMTVPQFLPATANPTAAQSVNSRSPMILFSLAVFTTIVVALAILLVDSAKRSLLDLWLMIVLVGMGMEVLTGLSWYDTPALGWHVGCLIDIVSDGAVLYTVLKGAVRCYRKLVQDNRTLNRLAMSDGLTGLSNRRHFDTELERSWKHAKRDDEWLSVVFIDLDGFKQYNDFYGHVEGDDCLRRVAATLKKRARRARDVTCRYGGDEFVTLLYGTDPVGAQAVAAAMQAEIWAMDLRHAFSHFGRVTVSVGVASVRPAMDGSTAVDLLRRADEALYRDKRVKRRPRLSQVDNSGVMDG